MKTSYITKQLKQFSAMSFIFLAVLGVNQNAFAQVNPVATTTATRALPVVHEVIYQTSALKVRAEDTKFITFDRGHYIDRISFEARRSLFCSKDAALRLTLDGYQHQTVKINQTGWRTYTATFSDFSKSLELKNLASSGNIKVKNIRVLPRRIVSHGGNGPIFDHISTGSDAYYQVAQIKRSVDFLFHVVDRDHRETYLDDFVVILGNSMAVLETSSDLSKDAREAVQNVTTYMDNISDFIDSLMQTPNLADLARELKSTERILKRMLQN